MIRLALSTSESIASVALSWEENEAQVCFDKKTSPAGETLIEKIGELLEKHRLPREKISQIGVNIGPGSFTGVRVGVATANALGLGLRVPVVGLSSLDLIASAWIFQHPGYAGTFSAAVDAGRKQCFAAFYSVQNETFKKTHPDALWEGGVFAAQLGSAPLAGWKLDSFPLSFEPLCPDALSGLRLLKQKGSLTIPSFASPNYVRATDAENLLKLKKNI